MSDFKQSWWDKNLPNRFSEFEGWVGPSSATSKEFFRGYIEGRGYKSLIDLGCGNATEFFAYKQEYPELAYLGVDSSEFLYNRNTELGIPMLLSPADDVPIKGGEYEVVFCRHVLEHQPHYEPVLLEMIRLAEKEAIHVFFIKPGEVEIIHYDSGENLYHNTYNKKEIDSLLENHKDVESFSWIGIGDTEIALSILKK